MVIIDKLFLVDFGVLQETLHMHKENNMTYHSQDVPKDPTSENLDKKHNNVDSTDKASHSNGNLFKNWPLMSTIVVYCVFSLQEMAYAEVSLFSSGLFWLSHLHILV